MRKKKKLSQIYCWLLKLNSKKTTWLKNVPKTLRDTSSKITYRWQTNIWKDALHHMSSGKCKLKQDTTMYLLEWPQSRTLTSARMWSNRNSLSLLVRTQHNTATSQDSSSQSSNCILCYILRGVENLSSHTRMVTVGLFITEKQPRCLSFSRTDRMDNEFTSRQWNIIQHITKWKKPT